ncbi:MAG TPA: dienelactone hydrolase family protein [Bacteroidales bacterium]|nr:dienelactone hydrolase family protein [Bacteroidales bacterium]
MPRYKFIEQGVSLDNAINALVLLHGRGGNAYDIISLADEFCDDSFYIVAPEASGNSWYPYSFLSPEANNEPWLSFALGMLNELIESISLKVKKENIFLMGFSQGACLSLEFGARYGEKTGGIIAFSGGLIGESLDRNKYTRDLTGTRIYIGNSDIDPHIPLSRSDESAELLRLLGAEVVYKVYPGMGHTITEEEIEVVKELFFVGK